MFRTEGAYNQAYSSHSGTFLTILDIPQHSVTFSHLWENQGDQAEKQGGFERYFYFIL